ncbi:MAG TPA: hypothetical protein VF110_05885 [Burkholderiales bacterium]|jgi:hypothetical protein
MKALVLAAALVFSLAAPGTTTPAPAAAPAAPQPAWPLILAGVAAALWVARRRLPHM